MPQSKWSEKDERKYKEIKKSQQERGASKDRAEEIAARTVNKGRRQEGRTPNNKSEGTGNPRTSLDERTKDELYNLAKQRNISGRSEMTKDELVKALRD